MSTREHGMNALVNLRRLKNITTECFEGAKEIGAGTVIGHKPTSKATQG